MPDYLGFLRAVNVGGRQFRTADLRAVLEGAGYTRVDTYIQTGNVRIASPMRSTGRVAAALEELFGADRGFEVPTIVFGPAEFAELVAEGERVAASRPELDRHYVSLLRDPAPADPARALEERSGEEELVAVRGRAVHLLCRSGYRDLSVTNAQVERTLGTATNRNLGVLRAIAARWCA